MGIFNNRYPYTDLHELNDDFMLDKVKSLENKIDVVMPELVRRECSSFKLVYSYDSANELLILSLSNQ